LTVIVSKKHVTPEIQLGAIDRDFSRADIEFNGVDHSGASFEARIFLSNPAADEHTQTSLETGYAGSFHIFGHGGCFGDEGHCEVVPRRAYDPRPAHPLSPARKVVIATEAIRKALQSGDTATVTVVPIVRSLNEKCDTEDVLHFDNVRIVTYR
jgi:hypothetical protein